MSHRRVKAIEFDDEDLYDEEDDFDEPEVQGPSAEDKEQLRLSAIEVREQLGPDFETLDQEIQETLWYYYYDIGKTVTYIKNKRKPAPSKLTDKAKISSTSATQSKPGHFLSSTIKHTVPSSTIQPHLPEVRGCAVEHVISKDSRSLRSLRVSDPRLDAAVSPPIISGQIECHTPISARDFFSDCPWFGVPPHRKAEIRIEPLYPRRGLLGGSPSNANPPKMSKLAALAAKRREEKERSQKGNTNTENQKPGDLSSSLQKLRLHKTSTQDHIAKRQKIAESQPTSRSTQSQQPPPEKHAAPQKVSETDTSLRGGSGRPRKNSLDDLPPAFIAGPANPSAAAYTLFGDADLTHSTSPLASVNTQQILYGSDAKVFDFTEPSPDDKVLSAQKGSNISKSSTKNPSNDSSKSSNKQLKSARAASEAANALQGLSIQSSNEPVRSKGIYVIEEYKKQHRKNAVNFVVVGHVDSGKSTIMGRLLHDTGAIDKRAMDVYRREADRTGKSSFAFAWILDQGREERERGVTMDISTNKFSTAKTDFTILDAPGHRDFVPNMIAGAAQADLAVLVIDATTGEFESGMKGQTREHALLVRSIGVQNIIVAVNKMDTTNWSQARFQEIQQQMTAFLSTAGFQTKNLKFIPCSGLTGANILTPLSNSHESSWAWYTSTNGPTLVSALDATSPLTHALEQPLRLTITDVFSSSPQNPLSVAGRIDSGTLQTGISILIQPSGATARIKSVDLNDAPSDWAVAGDNVVLNLTSIDNSANLVRDGYVVCDPLSSPIQNTVAFKAKVLAFEHLTPMFVTVHRGRQTAEAKVSRLLATLQKSSTDDVLRRKPNLVKPGEWARVEVEFLGGEKQPLDRGARVVLRSGGETVAAGLVE